jgi:TolB-like protein/tetratricopeptide (TPR) repeat protein
VTTFVSQLRERRIWRVVIAYPSVAFVLLQAVEFFVEHYGLDSRTLTLTIIVAIVLFPAAFVWNWRHGEAGSQAFSRSEFAVYAVSVVAAALAAGWYWSTAPQAIPTRADTLPPARSIAVMPFANTAGDTDVQYLCDGIAESLINWLATIPEVHVVSKGAAFRLREFAEDTGRIARELGVDSVIQGRLETVGDQVVVSAALVDTRDDRQLWGERVAKPRTDVINVERAIVAAIKDGLRLTVGDDLPELTAAGGTDNPEAYEAYMRGHFLIQSTNFESIFAGLDELREAIRLDPRFALPYADIADALSQIISYGLLEDEALKGEARNAAYSAIALAPELAEAHTALGTLHEYIDFDWDAAYAAYSKAVSLQPQRPAPYHRFTDHLVLTARFEEAREMAAAAIEIDALDGSAMHAVGLAHLASGNYEKAVEAMGDWNQFHPDSRWSWVKHALALAHNGQCEQAEKQALTAERMMDNAPPPLIDSWIAWGHRICGHEDHYARSRDRIEAHRMANPGVLHPGYAYLLALEGDGEGLTDFLEAVVEARQPFTPFVKVFSTQTLKLGTADAMRANDRYQALLKRLNFPARETQ